MSPTLCFHNRGAKRAPRAFEPSGQRPPRMTLRKSMAAVLPLLLPWLAAAAHPVTAGAWESVGGGPTIYAQGRWYELDLRPPAGPPGASAITTVYWSWSLSRTPPGLAVRLCRGTVRTCIDISGRQSGGTRAFAGRGADERFILAYRVPGSGAIAPVYGGSDHLIVNYRFPR